MGGNDEGFPGVPYPDAPSTSLRVLLLPPTRRDAEAIIKLLSSVRIECVALASITSVCDAIQRGVGAVILSEESLLHDTDALAAWIARQPVWSDLPLVVLTRAGIESQRLADSVARLGNVSLVERPVRISTLLSIVRAALRARTRQYEVRTHLAELDRSASALRMSEQRYRALATASSDVPFRMSADWSVLMPLDGRGLGLGNTEPIHDWMIRKIPPDEHARIRAAIASAIDGKSQFELEHRVICPDGSIGWTLSRAVPIEDEAGNVTEWFGVASDITERKNAEAALRESEARFRHMADSIPQLSWCARADGHIYWYNQRWYEYTGTTPQQMEGWGWRDVHDPAVLPRVLEKWRASLASGENFEMEFPLRGKDGVYRAFLTRVAPVRNETGQITQWFGTNTDISEQRRAAEEREQLLLSERSARNEAERLSRIKDEFLATLSHELRTPLNAIVGWSQIIRSAPNHADDVAEGIEVIERNARAQTKIIEDLLDMSRIISGKLRLDVQRIDLSAVIKAAADTVAPANEAKGIRVQLVLDPQAGPVSGDPNRLQQVFWNLLSNSIKFTPRGGRVQVVLERINSHLEVSISDTGEGIEPEFLPHVFDRFSQADATTTRRHGGLGLGLAIVKQLVELHGGFIRVKSPGRGQGSTFTVTLPLTVVHPDPEHLPVRSHPATQAVPVAMDACVKIAGVKVLVVDDEPDARLLLRRLLEDCKAIVTVAGSAAEAFSLLRRDRPDIIVSDIGMPGEDGYALIQRIRALDKSLGGNTPAIALTAYARSEDRVRAAVAGFQQHLSKPVEPAELIAVISSLINNHGRDDA